MPVSSWPRELKVVFVGIEPTSVSRTNKPMLLPSLPLAIVSWAVYHKQEFGSMHDQHVTTNRREFSFVPCMGSRRAVVLCVTLAALGLAVSIHAQETPSAPLDRDALITAAEQARSEERFNDAIRLYSRAEKDFGPDAKVFRGRAMAREMINEDRKAIEDYKAALRADPNDYESLERLAGIFERGGSRIADAILLYKRALDSDPRPESKENVAVWVAMLKSRLQPHTASAVGCWHLGNEKTRKGDYSAAESLYSRAMELNPQMFQAYFSRGLIHMKTGNASGALADFEQTVRLAPEFAQAFLQRGLAREQLGNLSAARQDFSRAAKMDPRDAAALYHLARTLESDGDQEGALRLYLDAKRCKPSRELSPAIQERLSALLTSLRSHKAPGVEAVPDNNTLW